MKALQMWVPPRWLHPALAFVLVAALMAMAGYIYTPSLTIVWPMAGVASIAISFICGIWNYDDRFGEQAFLGMMHFIVPPFGFAMWIADIQYNRRHNNAPVATYVPILSVAGVIGVSIFGLAVFTGALTLFAVLAWG